MLRRCLPLLTTAAVLAACGPIDYGGDDDDEPASRLTLSAAVPVEHDGALGIDGVATVTNERRLPDPFSAEPYCLVRILGARHPAGAAYDVAVAFAAADRRVLAVTVTRQPGPGNAGPWSVTAVEPPAAEVGVDLAQRVVTLSRLRSTQDAVAGWRATLDGRLAFPALTAHPDCGR